MIEILHPIVDAARVAVLLAPGSGYRLVDAWEAALPELSALDYSRRGSNTIDRRDVSPMQGASAWDDSTIEAATRYVVYPWRRTVVRLPDDHLFWYLRTARNRYLIDEEEQRTWSDALIGVAGLSIGSSALTVCSLTGARRFRLADPDTLGPTNLNRLAGSVCDLGEPKLTLAQRRTLETDPYSQIDSFPNGYSPELAAGFLGGGEIERLTVAIEEMDNLAMKIDLRLQARARQIPVIMATDQGDNVILDVERFDLDVDYPLFHGRAGDLTALDPDDLNDPARRVQIAVAIAGSQITPRLRYSLTEVGRSIPSWPQLGTAASLSGVVAALAARMLAGGQDVPSGRYRVDLDQLLLGDTATTVDRWNELDETMFLARMREM